MLNLQRPIAVGHRGAPAFLPENTVASFHYAFNILKADMVELDVRLSRDRVPVVFHDRKLARTTNAKGLVSWLTFRELIELDAGFRHSPQKNGHYPERGKGHRISSFEEVLAAFPGKHFAVDIKENSKELTHQVLELIARHNAERFCTVGSIYAGVGNFIQKTRPDMPRFLSQREVLNEYLRYRARRKPSPTAFQTLAAIPVKHLGLRLGCKGFVAYLKKRGIPVLFWTINSAHEIGTLLSFEADGIISDHPGLVVQALNGTDPKAA